MNRFIDNVSVLAIEDCLIGKLSELFPSHKVPQMSPDEISRLAGETTESSVERRRLVEKRKILDAGWQGLRSLQKQKHFNRPAESGPVPSEVVEEKPDQSTLSSRRASITSSGRGPSPVYTPRKVHLPLGGDF